MANDAELSQYLNETRSSQEARDEVDYDPTGCSYDDDNPDSPNYDKERYPMTTTHHVAVYHNVAVSHLDGHGLMWSIFAGISRGFMTDDPLAIVMTFTCETETEDPLEAAELAFKIGNVDRDMTRDPAELALIDEYRSQMVRSLSVGDVVRVDGDAYECKSMGFEYVPRTPVFMESRASWVATLLHEYNRAPSIFALDPFNQRFLNSLERTA